MGSGGGIASNIMQPSYLNAAGSAVAPMDPLNIPASAIGSMGGMTAGQALAKNGPGAFRTGLKKAGQIANAWDAAGGQPGQGQQQQAQPVSFNVGAAPYVPPQQLMGNAFYGG